VAPAGTATQERFFTASLQVIAASAAGVTMKFEATRST